MLDNTLPIAEKKGIHHEKDAVVRVGSTSPASAVAGAIAGQMREHQHADVQAIGPGAVNQAVKAIIIARGFLAGNGIDIVCVPQFIELEIDGQERTCMRFSVETRQL